jgi:hypothetical protein
VTEKIERVTLMTPEAILAFHDLFTAKAIEEGKDPTFNATLLFSPETQAGEEFQAMRAEASRVAQARFASEMKADPEFVKSLRTPFRRCEEKPKYYADLGPGWLFVNISTRERPGVVKPQGNGVVPVLDEQEVYPGCIVRATVSCYAYPKLGTTGPRAANKGVSFGLNNVLKVKDGAQRGGRPSAAADFAGVVKGAAAGAGSPASGLF